MRVVRFKGILLSASLAVAAAGCNSATSSKEAQVSPVGTFLPGEPIGIGSIKDDYIPTDITVKIYFVPKPRNTAASCPRYVDWPNVKLIEKFEKPDDKGKLGRYVNKVNWKAVTIEEDDYKNGFELVFSPFHVETDGGSGKITLEGVPKNVLRASDRGYDVEFKYTIIGLECRGQPLDPRFRVL